MKNKPNIAIPKIRQDGSITSLIVEFDNLSIKDDFIARYVQLAQQLKGDMFYQDQQHCNEKLLPQVKKTDISNQIEREIENQTQSSVCQRKIQHVVNVKSNKKSSKTSKKKR